MTEAAVELCDALEQKLKLRFDRRLVLLGAALHDAGKTVHRDEMSAPGHRHEAAGRALLLQRGVDAKIARFCVTHAAWNSPDCELEDLLVALADKLWKGKREDSLEKTVLERVATLSGRDAWQVFDGLDAICERVASRGEGRLARSAV